MSNKAYVDVNGDILGGTNGQVLTAHTGNDQPGTWETPGGGGGNVTTAGLTTSFVPTATGAASLGNSIISTNVNDVMVTGGANAATEVIVKPTTAGYAAFDVFQNSAGTASVYVGIDGTGLGQVPAGQGVIAVDGTVATNIYVAGGGASWASWNNAGLSLQGTRALTFNGGANFTYAEGTWTPTIVTVHGSNPSGLSYASQYGHWVRNGKMVTVTFQVIWSYTSAAADAQFAISGFPQNTTVGVNYPFQYHTALGGTSTNIDGFSTPTHGTLLANLSNDYWNQVADGTKLYIYSFSGPDAVMAAYQTGGATSQRLFGQFSYVLSL